MLIFLASFCHVLQSKLEAVITAEVATPAVLQARKTRDGGRVVIVVRPYAIRDFSV